MGTSRPHQRIQDILQAIGNIFEFTAGMKQGELETNIQKRYAVERCFLIISEAATKLGPLAEEMEPDMPWREIRDFGNVIRHAYDDVNATDMWDTIQNDLEQLKAACERMISRTDI